MTRKAKNHIIRARVGIIIFSHEFHEFDYDLTYELVAFGSFVGVHGAWHHNGQVTFLLFRLNLPRTTLNH